MDIDYQLHRVLADAFRIGYEKATIDCGNLKPYLSMAEAYRKYGRRVVNGWINEGLIEPVQDRKTPSNDPACKKNTSKFRLDRIKLETIAASANRN